MLNSIGLANPGRERFLAEHLPRHARARRLWVSVGGFSAPDYAETCAAFEDVAAIELNLSCPNVDEAPEGAAEIVAACRDGAAALREALAGSVGHRRSGAGGRGRRGRRALAREHAARARARRTDAPAAARPGTGGYSGPALKPVALAAVYACAAAVDLPIVGMGGSRDRARRARADRRRRSAVALGTVLFSTPSAAGFGRARGGGGCAWARGCA